MKRLWIFSLVMLCSPLLYGASQQRRVVMASDKTPIILESNAIGIGTEPSGFSGYRVREGAGPYAKDIYIFYIPTATVRHLREAMAYSTGKPVHMIQLVKFGQPLTDDMLLNDSWNNDNWIDLVIQQTPGTSSSSSSTAPLVQAQPISVAETETITAYDGMPIVIERTHTTTKEGRLVSLPQIIIGRKSEARGSGDAITLNRITIPFSYVPTATVRHLRDAVAYVMGRPASEIRLMAIGKEMQDNKLLRDVMPSSGDAIQITFNMPASVPTSSTSSSSSSARPQQKPEILTDVTTPLSDGTPVSFYNYQGMQGVSLGTPMSGSLPPFMLHDGRVLSISYSPAANILNLKEALAFLTGNRVEEIIILGPSPSGTKTPISDRTFIRSFPTKMNTLSYEIRPSVSRTVQQVPGTSLEPNIQRASFDEVVATLQKYKQGKPFNTAVLRERLAAVDREFTAIPEQEKQQYKKDLQDFIDRQEKSSSSTTLPVAIATPISVATPMTLPRQEQARGGMSPDIQESIFSTMEYDLEGYILGLPANIEDLKNKLASLEDTFSSISSKRKNEYRQKAQQVITQQGGGLTRNTGVFVPAQVPQSTIPSSSQIPPLMSSAAPASMLPAKQAPVTPPSSTIPSTSAQGEVMSSFKVPGGPSLPRTQGVPQQEIKSIASVTSPAKITLSAGLATMPGKAVADPSRVNEDVAVFDTTNNIYVLCDGNGKSKNVLRKHNEFFDERVLDPVQVASLLANRLHAAALGPIFDVTRLKKEMQAVHTELRRDLGGGFTLGGTNGSTAALARIINNQFFTLSVGDSPIALYTKNNILIPLSEDVASGYVVGNTAFSLDKVITRQGLLGLGDFILIISDGVTGELPTNDAITGSVGAAISAVLKPLEIKAAAQPAPADRDARLKDYATRKPHQIRAIQSALNVVADTVLRAMQSNQQLWTLANKVGFNTVHKLQEALTQCFDRAVASLEINDDPTVLISRIRGNFQAMLHQFDKSDKACALVRGYLDQNGNDAQKAADSLIKYIASRVNQYADKYDDATAIVIVCK